MQSLTFITFIVSEKIITLKISPCRTIIRPSTDHYIRSHFPVSQKSLKLAIVWLCTLINPSQKSTPWTVKTAFCSPVHHYYFCKEGGGGRAAGGGGRGSMVIKRWGVMVTIKTSFTCKSTVTNHPYLHTQYVCRDNIAQQWTKCSIMGEYVHLLKANDKWCTELNEHAALCTGEWQPWTHFLSK